MKKKSDFIIVILIFPVIISIITHFGYISGYVYGVNSPETFLAQYDFGIYKYRILSKYLLLGLNDILSQTSLNQMNNYFSRIVHFQDPAGTVSFYFSYFIINTFFAVLTSLTFYFLSLKYLLNFQNNSWLNIKSGYLSVILFNIGIAIFQYVLVPYDYISYFFNILAIYLYLLNEGKESPIHKILLLICIILSTLNRESSALILSTLFTIEYFKEYNFLKSFNEIKLPIFAFITTYILLRIFLGFESGFINNINLYKNIISPLNLFGIFTGITSVYLFFIFANNKELKKKLIYFLLFSSPYIITSLIGGIAFEIRLWTPILLNLAILTIYYNNKERNS